MPVHLGRPLRAASFATIVSIFLVIATLAGCGGDSATPTVPPTITTNSTPGAALASSSTQAPPISSTPSTSVASTAISNTPISSTSSIPSTPSITSTAAISTSGKTTITSVGSTALYPLIVEAAKQFKVMRPDIEVLVDIGGSGAGLTRVAADEVNIGNSDIYAEDRAGIDASSLVDHQVCGQGFAVAVNNGVTVNNLTRQQVVDIFTAKVTNWKEVGGQDLKIQIVARPKGSGTRTTFDRIVLNNGQHNGTVNEANGINLTQDSSATVAKAIADNPGAVGYLGLAYFNTNNAVKKVKYNGVDATTDNIINGSYPIWSYGHMYTKGAPDPASQAFIAFILSDKFQNQTVGKFDYIPISKLQNVKAP